MKAPVIVLKFGSSVLRTADDLPRAVHEIYRHAREGLGVVAVVSAFEGVTDRLIARARDLGADPDLGLGRPGLATLVAGGERETAAALQIALSKAGIPANVLDPIALALRVEGDGLEDSPIDLAAARVWSQIQKGRVLVVPGFFGGDEEGGVSLLGRGGSDWTALFLAQRLGARCRLLKDTDGIYERDPNGAGAPPLRFECLSFDDALGLRAPVVQDAALRFARSHGRAFEVAQIGSALGTVVGSPTTRRAQVTEARRRPWRVTLLGLGTVGRGVYEHLRRLPEQFEVAAIAVRLKERHQAAGVPGSLLCSLDEAVAAPADIVIEALGGIEAAGDALSEALRSGRHVVTANKAVMAARGRELREIAERAGRRILESAAVGGVTPVLELLRGRRRPVVRVEGVLNGTSNFVLDRLAARSTPEAAIAEAQALGYAEADPTEDLSGLDAARKLSLIAREAFGVDLDLEDIPLPHKEALTAWRPDATGSVGRLIAWVEARPEGCAAGVDLRSVNATHPLASCRGADNAVLITLRDGEVIERRGRGAGRWPTAESVMGDLLELWRETSLRRASPTPVLGEFEARAS